MAGITTVASAVVLGSSAVGCGLPAAASREGFCIVSGSSTTSGSHAWAVRGRSSSLVASRGAGAGRGQVELRPTRSAAQKDESKGNFPWFKFGSNGLDSEGAGIYGSQKREDFDRDDVEQYFNYMGMLATEGTYDKMEALLNTGIQAVDILLLLAASEGDTPKIEELLRAGADYRVKDDQGRNALDRAQSEEIRELILSNSQAIV